MQDFSNSRFRLVTDITEKDKDLEAGLPRTQREQVSELDWVETEGLKTT